MATGGHRPRPRATTARHVRRAELPSRSQRVAQCSCYQARCRRRHMSSRHQQAPRARVRAPRSEILGRRSAWVRACVDRRESRRRRYSLLLPMCRCRPQLMAIPRSAVRVADLGHRHRQDSFVITAQGRISVPLYSMRATYASMRSKKSLARVGPSSVSTCLPSS